MRHSFFGTQFGRLDRYGFAPRVPIEMGNRIVGRKASNLVQSEPKL